MKSSFPTLEKKVPESKKYAHIASSIDTGASAKKEKLHSANVTAKRKDEIFKRVRPSTLVRLLQDREVSESVYAMGPGSERGDDASSVRASKEHRGVSMSVASVGSVAGPGTLGLASSACGSVNASSARAMYYVELHFEKSVLTHALSKHVHRFDYRDGMAVRKRPKRVEVLKLASCAKHFKFRSLASHRCPRSPRSCDRAAAPAQAAPAAPAASGRRRRLRDFRRVPRGRL
ncbi:unnamed protein product [Effrenium voratum]|nr:unnamed protein product [Effrenium voratum]